MSKASELSLITSSDEQQQILESLASTKPILIGLAADNTTFRLQLLAFNAPILDIHLLEPSRPVAASESLTIVFGQPSGHYYWKAKLTPSGINTYSAEANSKLYRMQRRSDFRAPLPPNYKVSFECTHTNNKPVHYTFSVFDVGAGGIGINLPAASLFATTNTLQGILRVPDHEPLTLTGIIRHIEANGKSGAFTAGIAFLNLTPPQKQELFTITLKAYRLAFGGLLD